MLLTKRRVPTGAYYGASLAAAAAAAGAAYFLDPKSGRRRRALVRDRTNRITHQTQEFVAKAGRDARQRARGVYEHSLARLRGSNLRGSPKDDRILEERIRAALGRVSGHPGAVEITCSNGVAHVRGDVLEHELPAILSGIRHVRGVDRVVNEARVHRRPGNISQLRGEAGARPARFEYLQQNWSPAPRLLAGALGFGMIGGGLARRTPVGLGVASLGAALLGRSIWNMPLPHLLGIRTSPRGGVLVQKSIRVHADVDEAYSRWRELENFPQFMNHVREVRKIDDTHYHWKVDGPAGVPVEWDAQVTADVPGQLIAWRTVEHSAVRSTGVVQFEPTAFGGTRIQVRMAYRPPANLVGHTVAKIFGRDPQRQIDADLARFKTYIETGRRSSDSAAMQARH